MANEILYNVTFKMFFFYKGSPGLIGPDGASGPPGPPVR